MRHAEVIRTDWGLRVKSIVHFTKVACTNSLVYQCWYKTFTCLRVSLRTLTRVRVTTKAAEKGFSVDDLKEEARQEGTAGRGGTGALLVDAVC